jgi:hypothetical protein
MKGYTNQIKTYIVKVENKFFVHDVSDFYFESIEIKELIF